jgi:hypothetical protein
MIDRSWNPDICSHPQLFGVATFLKPPDDVTRTSPMERRDIIMVVAVLLLTIVITWAGTDYVVTNVVMPLVEDESAPSPSYPGP